MDAFEVELADPEFSLTRACLLVARDARPALDVDAYLARFEPWAMRVRDLRDELTLPAALTEVLVVEEAFRPVVGDYYDPENSLLDAVLDRRQGLPIMHAVVWLEVARRPGEPLVGVGLPGHFLLRYEDTLLDPYHGGVALTEEDAQRLLDGLTGGGMELRPAMLHPTGDRDMLARVLANLKNAYVRAQDPERALRVEDRVLQLNPFAFPEYRDRGLLKQALGDREGAREDLRRYLEGMPAAPDADAVRRLLERR